MGLLTQFPYTNIHEMNLDWILSEIRKLIDSNNELFYDFNELKTYVVNYLENLDIDEKIHEAIQELIDSGEIERIILDAFNALDKRVNALEAANIQNWYYAYTKVGNETNPSVNTVQPIIGCYNPVRGAVTYFTGGDDNDDVRCGDLKTDMITPLNEAATLHIGHINDATYCNYTNEILLGCYIDGTPKIYRLNPASLMIKGELDITGWNGTSTGEVACDNEKNIMYIGGESTLPNFYHIGIMDMVTGEIIKQGDVRTNFVLNDNEFPWGFVQGSEVVGGEWYSIITCRSEAPRQGGFILTSWNFEDFTIKNTKYFNVCGEAEGIFNINENLYVLGYSESGRAQIAATCTLLTIRPWNQIARTIYIDETAELNGNGSQNSPYNNLSSGLYEIQNNPELAGTGFTLLSDITKPVITPINNSVNNVIRINGNNKKLTIANIVTFTGVKMYVTNLTLATASESVRWIFENNSDVTFSDCTFEKDYAGNLIFVYQSNIKIVAGTALLNSSDAFGIMQLRYTSFLICEWTSITSAATTNRLVNALGGFIANVRAISTSTLAEPFNITGGSVMISK